MKISKKLAAALFSVVLLFSPVGNVIFTDDVSIVEAKKYRSGKKSFNLDNNRSDNNTTNFQKKNDTNQSTVNRSAANQGKTGGFFGGGFMKGLMLGGLAGLLFAGLGGLGIMGQILGLIINVLAIVLLIAVIRKIYLFFKDKKKKEEPNPWRN